jgi:Uma2 family endonuclease
MPTELPRALLEVRYYQAAQDYLRKLPLEHFMESTPQATQREITLESLALVKARRPEVQVFNELLVQYPLPRKKRPGQVVPDNMVVVHPEPIKAEGSYDVPLQPVGPFWVLEYVSKNSRRKDYDDNMRKYEHELKVPYYLLFVPDQQELTLYHHTGQRYVSVPPDEQGRHELKDLDLAMGLVDGWVRYWYRDQLVPLPAELQRSLDRAIAERNEAIAKQNEAIAKQNEAIAKENKAIAERDEARRERETERQARLAAERELAELRQRMEEMRSPPNEG